MSQETTQPTYQQAFAELQTILDTIRSERCDVDSLVALTTRAGELLDICRQRLTTTSEALAEALAKLENQ